ncbi:hypothetical protein [Maledivibacter halophilus]|uniref:Transposase zinc-ribbon domain-containing protein n=1 Tax=Maledivibacter halophilus TaxID=36842 RepID=A0A1T5MFI1_9FIRM|nr:hypothetical protein [Maledivibacter halophilus]SKC86915.1 hypothetical protein SAMN02194393_04597 [Maledivibacter halophilus]
MIKGQITLEDVVNFDLKISPKPYWIKVSKNKIWCPYCNRIRTFKNNSFYGVRKCEVCGISIKDYYVKKFNKLELI